MQVLFNSNFRIILQALRRKLLAAPVIDVGEWQAVVGAIPQSRTAEVQDISLDWPIPPDHQVLRQNGVSDLQEYVRPNLPWAEDHFLERISGNPLNPPPSSEYWPFAVQGNAAHKKDELFSHTYPERLWPCMAGDGPHPLRGIRFEYGDLGDAVELLRTRPGTRQAYIPIWYPEDTGAREGQRVPCTLGYHLMARDGRLKIVYYIRSCDFMRHFRDDVYMAARLCQWVCDQLGGSVQPGNLIMHISSLHVFESDLGRLGRLYRQEAIEVGE